MMTSDSKQDSKHLNGNFGRRKIVQYPLKDIKAVIIYTSELSELVATYKVEIDEGHSCLWG